MSNGEVSEQTALVTVGAVKEGVSISRFVKRAELFKPEAIDPILDAYEAQARSIVLADVSTAKGRKERISLAAAVCSSKTAYDKERDTYLKDLRETVNTTNKAAGKVWDRLEALQKEIRQPVTDWENAEKTRVAMLEGRLANLQAAASLGLNPAISAIEAATTQVESEDPTTYAEFERRAQLAKEDALHSLRTQLAVAQQREAERVELETLRAEAAERAAKAEQERLEREEKERAEAYASALLKEAADKAERERKEAADKAAAAQLRIEQEKHDAEARALKAEAEAKAAAEKAERDRIEAEAKAKRDAQAAVEAERQRVAREKSAEEEAERQREANRKHVAKINREAMHALMHHAAISEEIAQAAVKAIVKGSIPHIKISY